MAGVIGQGLDHVRAGLNIPFLMRFAGPIIERVYVSQMEMWKALRKIPFSLSQEEDEKGGGTD